MHLVLFILCGLEYVLAAPASLHARQADSMTPSVYVPVVLIVILIIFATVLASRNTQLRQWLHNFGSTTSSASANTVASTRELTADELAAGTTNSSTTNGRRNRTAATSTTAPARRARRTRRTPSQISTKSLPAYNKEPGDEELVIYRGPSEFEEEDDEGDSMHSTATTIQEQNPSQISHDLSQSRVSLLRHTSDQEVSAQAEPRTTPRTFRSQSSFETMDASDESSSGLLVRLDPRGEAPAYEVIDLNDDQHGDTTLPPPREEDTTSDHEGPQTSPASERRRFRFMSFFMPRSSNTSEALSSSSRRTSSHTRDDSGPSFSTLTSVTSHGGPLRQGGRARQGHRSDNSSGSGLNLSAIRKGSNFSDASGLAATSSLISLNSISAPLTHTAVRTEFTYPPSGPTPEQVKFISSRETFGRFGLPYGPDAIAFAASTSMQELMPPPDFETVQAQTVGTVSNLNDDLPNLPTDTNDAQSSAEPAIEVTNTNETSTSSSDSSPSSSGDFDIIVSSQEPVPDEPLPAQDQKPILSLATIPPLTFPFDIGQTLSPDLHRTVSVASSSVTFDTLNSESLSPNGPMVHIIAPSARTSMVSIYSAELRIESDDEKDDGESIRVDAGGNKDTKTAEICDSDSEYYDGSEESQGPTEESMNIAKHIHENTETAVTSFSPPESPRMESRLGPVDSPDSSPIEPSTPTHASTPLTPTTNGY